MRKRVNAISHGMRKACACLVAEKTIITLTINLDVACVLFLGLQGRRARKFSLTLKELVLVLFAKKCFSRSTNTCTLATSYHVKGAVLKGGALFSILNSFKITKWMPRVWGICGQMYREKSELKTLEIPCSFWPASDPPGGPDLAVKVINNLKIYVSKKC